MDGVKQDAEGLESCELLGKRVAIAANIMRKAQEFKMKIPPLYE